MGENDIDLYTVPEVAEKLKLSKGTIENLLKTKKIKAHKLGRQWRIKHDDLLEYINSGSNQEQK